ncbi:hypothetical protein F5X71_34390 [Nocardia brasiliensis]|uniref:Uncharacterized protein n=1 Tax=Nocardia brasiliensis TaxID=37326 RepID=A0A6G9Y0J5_NOCBR|nr:hypothetical protein [Nocardia brasiliensis]QIS06722.1 hypothetical protein F5X71_34390 [Nocardia brasiliensis]
MPHVFNTACQQNHRLSTRLNQIIDRSGLRTRFFAINTVEELERFESEFSAELEGLRPTMPSLGGVRAWVDPDTRGRPVPNSKNAVNVHRHYIAIQVDGDHSLLECWPDAADGELEPVDAAEVAEAESVGLSSHEVRYRLTTAQEMWLLVCAVPSTWQWALYTFVELSQEEEREVETGQRDLQSTFDQRMALAQEFVARIAAQTNDFFDVVAPQEFQALIGPRRVELQTRTAVTAGLRFPQAWRVREPALAAVQPAVQEPKSSTEAPAPTGDTFRLATRARLDPATFDDVQRVIRVWADAIERYPGAYHGLKEDRVSDLLAATLNATLPGAQREVYSREGKSDIFIHADTLAAGTGPTKVFICETKWANGDAVVREAVDPQLFGYLNSHDTAAVLLLLMNQKDCRTPIERRLTALREVTGFVGEEPGPSEWPIFEYTVGDRRVHLCVATVHIPPPRSTESGD